MPLQFFTQSRLVEIFAENTLFAKIGKRPYFSWMGGISPLNEYLPDEKESIKRTPTVGVRFVSAGRN